MIVLDANLLLYAFRHGFFQHAATRLWLEGKLKSGGPVVLHPLAAAAFLRIATRPILSLPAAPMRDALRFLHALEERAVRLNETSTHGKILARLCERHGIQGNGITDAWLAAFAIVHGITLASHDQGFARFGPELDWLDPLSISG